jgi:hypothetical protein
MTKKEILVRNVTPEAEVQYGVLSVAFYDNPRTFTPKGKDKEITENRLYVSIDSMGMKQHVKRKVSDDERDLLISRYRRAYDLYLAAKKAGGKLDETTTMLNTIAEKNEAIRAQEKEAEERNAEIQELQKKIAEFEAAKASKASKVVKEEKTTKEVKTNKEKKAE